jgi:hypothetical protein
MKKSFMLVFFVILGIHVFGQVTSSPIIGYDGMTWETTLDDFLQLYPNATETDSDDADLGVRQFWINSTRFVFFRNELYQAYIDYDENFGKTVLDKLISAYGNRFGRETISHHNGTSSGASITYTYHGHYHITFSYGSEWIYDDDGGSERPFGYSCQYENPIITNRINSAKEFAKKNSSPIVGYGNMAWGTTVDEYLRLSPNSREGQSEDADLGIRLFLQFTMLESYSFYFFQDKLYRVEYYQGEGIIREDVLNRFISIYGMYDDIEKKSYSNGTAQINETTYTINHSNALTIRITGGYWENFDSSFYKSVYENPIIVMEIENLKNLRN